MTALGFTSRLQMAQRLLQKGQYAAAAEAYQRLILSHTGKHLSASVLAFDGLGRSLLALGELENAQKAFEESLHIMKEVFGPNHAQVALALQNLSRITLQRGAAQEAEHLAENAIATLLGAEGANTARVADALFNLAQILIERGAYNQAEARIKQAWGIWEALLGAQSTEISACLASLGHIRTQQGQLPEAALLHKQAADLRLALLGDHPETALSFGSLGTILALNQQWEEACQALEEALSCYHRLDMEGEAPATFRINLEQCRLALVDEGEIAGGD